MAGTTVARSVLRRAGRHVSLAPALLLVLLPKCPLCLAGWWSVLGSIGASAWVQSAWGWPLGVALLSSAVGGLIWRGHRRRDYRPALLGVIGAAGLLWGRCLASAPASLPIAGAVVLVVASSWSLRGSLRGRALPSPAIGAR